MTKIVFILLIPLFSFAQQNGDTLSPKWIKVCSISNNGTSDEWIRAPMDNDRHTSPYYIHDTIYVDSFKIGLYNKVNSLLAKYAQQKTPETIQLDTSYFTKMGLLSIYRYTKQKHIKKRKKTLDEYGGDREAFMTECPLDTVSGTIVYNSGFDQGNTFTKGIWVGCFANYIWGDSILMIPSRYLLNYKDRFGHVHTVGSVTGKFYTEDNKKIANWRVYVLIVKTH